MYVPVPVLATCQKNLDLAKMQRNTTCSLSLLVGVPTATFFRLEGELISVSGFERRQMLLNLSVAKT
jgi:hypothetical protein